MCDFRLFSILDDETKSEYEIRAIHDEGRYRHVRQALSRQYDRYTREPNIQVWNVYLRGDRPLTLRHVQHFNRPLHDNAQELLTHVGRLWGFGVQLDSINRRGEVTRRWKVPTQP
jgi:stage V sporulation protein R